MKATLRKTIGILVSAGVALFALPAQAVISPADAMGLDLGFLNNYAVVQIGTAGQGNGGFTMNSGPVQGNVLVGQGSDVVFSGGNNGEIQGTLYRDNTTTVSGHLQIGPPTTVLVDGTFTLAAKAKAQSVSDYAAGLASRPNAINLANIADNSVLTGNGGLNIYNVGNINNADFTLAGTANDYFVFNISGAIQTNRVMTLNGVNPDRVLFNLLSASNNIFQTSGGDILYGNYLATHGGSFQFSNLDLRLGGELINIDGHIQLVSGSEITASPIPEVSSLLPLFGVLSLACGVHFVRRNRGTLAVEPTVG